MTAAAMKRIAIPTIRTSCRRMRRKISRRSRVGSCASDEEAAPPSADTGHEALFRLCTFEDALLGIFAHSRMRTHARTAFAAQIPTIPTRPASLAKHSGEASAPGDGDYSTRLLRALVLRQWVLFVDASGEPVGAPMLIMVLDRDRGIPILLSLDQGPGHDKHPRVP